MSGNQSLTMQEEFWRGAFGREYIARNSAQSLVAANVWFFARALSRVRPVSSVLEVGANVGMNLRALQTLFPGAQQTGLEINAEAAGVLRSEMPECQVIQTSLIGWEPNQTWDLVISKGVLIHMPPTALLGVYTSLSQATGRYLLLAEFFSPNAESVEYRGRDDLMWRRDFVGEMLDHDAGLSLIDYGFAYRGDALSSQDDLTWFLIERLTT